MLYLQGIKPEQIMMWGRWLSTAFMKYIRQTAIVPAATKVAKS